MLLESEGFFKTLPSRPDLLAIPRLKDGYLLENCLAVLINLAPQTEHLQPYAAQRLVAVLISASRLWIEGASAAAEAAAGVEQARKSAVEAPGGVASGQGGAPGGALATVSEAVGTSGADGEEFEGGLSDVQVKCAAFHRLETYKDEVTDETIECV